jgi:hypothetical protein
VLTHLRRWRVEDYREVAAGVEAEQLRGFAQRLLSR